jgi:Uma2 family endonuclease
MTPIPKRSYTENEFLDLLAASDTKLEFWDGEIAAMAGAQPRHVDIEINLLAALLPQLQDSPCRGATSNQAIRAARSNSYFFPDFSIACGERKFYEARGISCLENPAAVFEVLSPSTAEHDRRSKLHAYTKIRSLRDYVLIDSAAVDVILYSRSDADEVWRAQAFADLSDTLLLSSCGASLTLAQIYAGL